MYRLIQVPLDGSSFAEQALPLAVRLAQRNKADIEVIRVHEPIRGLDQPADFESRLDHELMNESQTYLDGIVNSLKEVVQTGISSKVMKGPVVETILKLAAERRAELMVMTTHARGPLGRFWYGSTADALVRQSPIPILLVPPKEAAPDVRQPPELPQILIPLDGSELAEQAIEPALALGGKEQAVYTLLRVVKPVIAVYPDRASGRASGLSPSILKELEELHQREQAAGTKYLEQLAQGLSARSFTVHTKAVLDDLPANAILEHAAENNADAIAMTTRAGGGLKRLFLGSVAERVLRGAATPILICPPAERPIPKA